MVRPNKQWEKKYGKQTAKKEIRLSMNDDILSASAKLTGNVPEAQAILLQALRHLDMPAACMRLLDMDDMQMYGNRIVQAYHNWAKNDYQKLVAAVQDRDPNLLAFIRSVQE